MKKTSKKTLVVNLLGGPGTGKSTFCAGIFAALKWDDVDCEMALEYAKDLVWDNNLSKLENQLYVFGKQQSRLFRLNGKVDVVVTDAPLFNSIIYDAKGDKLFTKLVLREQSSYENLNIFLVRKKKYNPNGRHQTFAQAKELDKKILNALKKHRLKFEKVEAVPENIPSILGIIKRKI
jgi:nicotinamide riboside kinase